MPIQWENILIWSQRLFVPKPLQPPLLLDSLHETAELFESGMFDHANFIHRQLFSRVLPYIRVDKDSLEAVKQKAKEGTLVYLTPFMGQFEFNLFNYLVQDNHLPAAAFNNKVRISRWIPRREHRTLLKKRLHYLKYCENLPDPVLSGFLTAFVAQQNSVLLALDSNDPTFIAPNVRDTFLALISAQRQSDKPIFLVPQQLVWDKRPAREAPSIFEALFGVVDNPGPFRKLILLFRHYKKRSIVRFGAPISLRDFAASDVTAPETITQLYRQILLSFVTEKKCLTGPPIRPRRWFLERIAEDPELEKMLYALAKEKEKSVTDLKRLAMKYAKEISSDVSTPYLEFLLACLNWFFKHFYKGIYVDPEEIKKLKQAIAKGPLVLTPNHRSHVDYLLIGYLLYQHDIAVPQTAGGINMAFWPLGRLGRRCGAFFMRRTFQGNPIYKQVFQTYLKILVREGYLQEFFIEGGRSRTGKLRMPKRGMLAMYSQVMMEHAATDLQFLPTCITYEKILEQKSYTEEIEGKIKQKEKTRDLLKLRNFLFRRSSYGQIYVHFDAPISWNEVVATTTQKTELVNALANRITHAINRQAVVTPTALAATALLTHTSRGITLSQCHELFAELLHYLRWKSIKMSDLLKNSEEFAFKEAMQQFQSSRLLNLHQGLEGDFYEVSPNARTDLDYYKNTAIHYFVSLSLWSNLLLQQRSDTFSLTSLIDDYSDIQKLFSFEFRFSTRLPLKEHLDNLCRYLAARQWITYDGETIVRQHEGKRWLKHYRAILNNFMESYWIALKTCLSSEVDQMEIKTLIQLMHDHGKHLFLLGRIHHPEAVSQANFENAIAVLIELKVLRHHEKEMGPVGREIVTTVKNSKLEQTLQVKLEQLLSNHF